MVTWGNNDIGTRILHFYPPAHISYAWRGVSPAWLKKYVAMFYHWQLLFYEAGVFLVCHNPHVLIGANTLKTVIRHLYQRATCP